MEEGYSLTNGAVAVVYPQAKTSKKPQIYIKVNLKWIMDLNVKYKTFSKNKRKTIFEI